MRYSTGEEARPGDHVLWHGSPAVLEFVATDPSDWYVTELGPGLMVNPPMAYEKPGDPHLIFVARAHPSNPTIAPMTIDDYDAMIQILTTTPGLALRAADSRPAIERYLHRNPGLSLTAKLDSHLAAFVLCGHDGRRGYLHHLAVIPDARRQGLGSLLVQYALAALHQHAIDKVHIDVFNANENALRFWQALGWQPRHNILRLSFTNSSDPNV